MPDWRKITAEYLKRHAVSDDVIRELAAHLEEVYEQAVSQGAGESDAMKISLQEVEDWRVLAKQICQTRSEENAMNHRTRTLWVPGMITLLAASLSLMALQLLGYRPNLIWKGPIAVMFYWPWLATLPVFGATGAFLAQRAHARQMTRLAVAASPALLLLVVMSLILPLEMLVEGFWWFRFVYFAVAILNWVAVPGTALLIGAAPFLRSNAVSADSAA